ncbi:MAG: DNA repair protein RadA [Deltaproteobacteria bacterium]|nr:DNA repair protein RadA [Deltaproteobacteria bacterium]MDQ3301090.1 DNA repair protein RadA [Myxococcota bacterium]
MAKIKALKVRTAYRCQACAHVESRWLGRCPACQEWSSLVEEIEAAAPPRPSAAGVADGASPISIVEVVEISAKDRRSCGIGELDRVLGGGLVAGCLVLLGGDPGVGKSTLLVQALAGLARSGRVLYATGEESVAQTAMRARRVGAADARLAVVAETDVEKILAHARAELPAILAVDSIQTMYTPLLDSIPGSLAQVRECASRLMQFAKTTGVPTILVGHVTKDGALAGPKTLEHLVDVVLQLEGDGGPYRILRAHKNRFGSTQEIGVFEMRGAGIAEVTNPSAHLLAERPLGAPGSVVVASADGARPLLVEIQALVAPASAGVGRRTAAGVDGNRVSLLLAVLAQRASCDVLDRDVFVNVAGGIRLGEPAIDLGVACAIASSARGRAIDARTVMFGEVGLAGEIRAVPLCEQRLGEAARLGFTRALIPAQNLARLDPASRAATGMELVAVDRLVAAIAEL